MIDPDQEREDFISIRQLVALIAEATGKTEQQAAATVSANLARHSDWRSMSLYEWAPALGCTILSGAERIKAQQRLARWGTTGSSASEFEDINDVPF